ncbi:TIGR01777 family oxidoreductase [Conexibacter sp. CPCC 206217]|uniref:TIGR01777 family oxidoreductase n=1 Tax=Conexibacter sp. CPCC 206217 TaxID=3064574 RepID=UPI00272228A3|nr:TIGR01777 family oxidoreductase [Conexibacter sp. CPCC 206217]MDO8210968.1 TIGR01777 family oxidoreductase [Conexibacter sp. CPCC 206217]
MRVTVTGATGLIGTKLVAALSGRGDQVTVLSRNPGAAREKLGHDIEAVAWDPSAGPAPVEAMSGRDGVVHLAGEPVAQRWSDEVKARIRESRSVGTRNLVASLGAAEPRPRVLVSASAVGYYGPHGEEQVDESTPPGSDFLAGVCVAWEHEALAAEDLGVRVARVRTGVVLDPDGGALAKMLTPFKLGAGGPVAGGRQYMPWIHADDLVGIYLAALDGDDRWAGALNGSAPTPVTNAEFSKALGHALHRPAVAPIPRLALKLLYGEMEQIVTTGQRAVPKRPLELGYAYKHPQLDEALRAALS